MSKLSSWFGVEFHIVDGTSGELLHCALDHSAVDWNLRGELCREVASRGTPEIIEEEAPLLVIAIPLEVECGTLVAVGTFVDGQSARPTRPTRAAKLLGLEVEDAIDWIHAQTSWTPDALLQMARLAREQVTTARRMHSLEAETQVLSHHLSTTYEEISLLYRLTQNLKLSSKAEELGALALEWLSDVLPAESLAIQLTRYEKSDDADRDARSRPVMLTFGPCPVDALELNAIIQRYDLTGGSSPLIINQATTHENDWAWSTVRELIAAPLCEGSNCFGWLVAFNRLDGREFGTVEASLLSSVGTILGIHSGNAELYHQQREFFAGVVRALTAAIDAKDPYTCGHSDRVARVAVCLAERLGLDPKEVETIYLSGLLHDVGKIGIDDNVLRKPGKLTDAEYEHIKTHAQIGYNILRDIKQLDEVLPVVLHHHEQWDGKGYPHKLAGEDIPLLARIVAVADSFDAMSSDRPYRQGMDDAKLDGIMRSGAGAQWDARVIDAFFSARDEIRMIAKQKVKNLTLDLREWT